MTFDEMEAGAAVVIAGLGPLQKEETIDQLGERLKVLRDERRSVVLNLRGAHGAKALMLGVFVRAHQGAKELGLRLLFCNLEDDVRNVFNMTRLTEVFEIFETEDLALASLTEKGP